MFSFVSPLLIILSIGGIIYIILRRSGKTNLAEWPAHVRDRIFPLVKAVGRKLWHFVLEVKGLPKSQLLARLPKTFPKFHLPKKRLPFRLRGNPNEVYLASGEESLERGDFEEAERQFIRAIEKEPNSRRAYEGLGKLYMIQKKHEDAVETYKFLTKQHPESDTYFSNLAVALHAQKLYDRAIEAYEQAIAIAPDVASRYLNLGLTLEAKRHLEEAILNYRRAAELEPENTHFLMVLSEALIKKKDREEAELILEKILQIEPTNHLAREKLMQLKF